MRCHQHDLEFVLVEELQEHVLNDHLYRLETLMTEINEDQKHLDADVAALKDAFAAEVAALKAQIASNGSIMAANLDFSGLDALVGAEQAEVNTIPTLTPSDDPSLSTGGGAAVATIGGTAQSPFAEPNVDDTEQQDDDALLVDEAAGTTADPTADVAPNSPGVTADDVVDPDADITPSTEDPATEPA